MPSPSLILNIVFEEDVADSLLLNEIKGNMECRLKVGNSQIDLSTEFGSQ